MKNVIADIVKSLFNAIFSIYTFCVCILVFLVWLAISLSAEQRVFQEQRQQRTDACYSQGMVLISTDAGPRCVDPRTLVKVK